MFNIRITAQHLKYKRCFRKSQKQQQSQHLLMLFVEDWQRSTDCICYLLIFEDFVYCLVFFC